MVQQFSDLIQDKNSDGNVRHFPTSTEVGKSWNETTLGSPKFGSVTQLARDHNQFHTLLLRHLISLEYCAKATWKCHYYISQFSLSFVLPLLPLTLSSLSPAPSIPPSSMPSLPLSSSVLLPLSSVLLLPPLSFQHTNNKHSYLHLHMN